jgi:hypothetical protein
MGQAGADECRACRRAKVTAEVAELTDVRAQIMAVKREAAELKSAPAASGELRLRSETMSSAWRKRINLSSLTRTIKPFLPPLWHLHSAMLPIVPRGR